MIICNMTNSCNHAAVIPKFVMQLMRLLVINGDGEYSRDFTYIDNVIQANCLAFTAENAEALNTVYNVAYVACLQN